MRPGILHRLGALGTLLALLTGCGDDPGYTRKAGRWHHDDQPVAVADAGSFQPLDARFARDAVQGYYRGQAIAGTHGPTFQVLSEHEARDRQAVYRADTYRKAQEYWSIRHVRVDVIAGADPARYQVLGHGYSRDDRQVWYDGQPFAVRDPASFTPIDSNDLGSFNWENIEAHPFRIDTEGGIGRPTPEGAHRDGVDLVAVLLMARVHIKGGETRVFEAHGPQGQRFTLTEPGSLLLLDDPRVIHEATPIQPEGAARGHRDTLVITLRAGGFQGP